MNSQYRETRVNKPCNYTVAGKYTPNMDIPRCLAAPIQRTEYDMKMLSKLNCCTENKLNK